MKTCTYPGCDHKFYAKGLCRAHYVMHYVRGNELRPLYTKKNPKPKTQCKHTKCAKIAVVLGLCQTHYARLVKYGDINAYHTPGRKSQGGHQAYPDHSLLKRNRLIKFEQDPICEVCGVNKARIAHHRDGKKTNHAIENLMSICSQKCHKLIHRKLVEQQTYYPDLNPEDVFTRKEVEVLFKRDQTRKIYPMKIICSWCRKHVDTKFDTKPDIVTHTICPECVKKIMK